MPPQDAYLESQVLTADPLELVRLLYRAAMGAARTASAHMACGRIAERARQISKAHAILSHLAMSLDHGRGGAISKRLADLYDYMQRRLLEANIQQKPEPLAEVESLLATLLEGWEQTGTPAEQPAAVQDSRMPESTEPAGQGYAAVFAAGLTEYGSQNWSF